MIQDNFHIPSIYGYIIIVAAAIGGLWMSTSASKPQKVVVVQAPDISIHEAAYDGNIEAVKQHLAAGTDVNAKDEYSGYTSLHHAANHGLNEIAKLLIKKGANVNLKADFGYTPLMLATNTVIAELLIKNGANVNATHQHGTGLHIASGVGNRSVVEWFIANGADVNAKSDFGTPLDFAIVSEYTETADLLRKNGAKTTEELKAEGN